MSPCVTASSATGNETCMVFDCPGVRSTRVKPTSLLGGAITALTGWCTYTGTMFVPARLPVLVTVNVAVTVPAGDTLLVAESPLVWKVV